MRNYAKMERKLRMIESKLNRLTRDIMNEKYHGQYDSDWDEGCDPTDRNFDDPEWCRLRKRAEKATDERFRAEQELWTCTHREDYDGPSARELEREIEELKEKEDAAWAAQKEYEDDHDMPNRD